MAGRMTMRLVERALLVVGVAVGCLMSNGCENMTEADAASLALAGVGMNASTPEQAQAAGLLSGFAAEAGRRQHEMNVAQAGRSQVTINGGNSSAGHGAMVSREDTSAIMSMGGSSAKMAADKLRQMGYAIEERLVDFYQEGEGYKGKIPLHWLRLDHLYLVVSEEAGIYKLLLLYSDGTSTAHFRQLGPLSSSNGLQSATQSQSQVRNAVEEKMANGMVYTGPVIRGSDGAWRPHGRGLAVGSDGCKYDGEFREGTKHGWGVLVFPNGDKYEGEFKDDEYNGRGTCTLAAGPKYNGEWRNDRRHGRGIFTISSSEGYDGEWKDDHCDGRGVYTWPDGRRYEGEWKDSQPNGHGTLTRANGSKYDGEWKDGDYHGQGRLTAPDGTDWSGEWRVGKPYRIRGTKAWPDGTKYVGEWNWDGSKNTGTITWADGRIYQGNWKIMEGQPDLPAGYGRMAWPDGRRYVGDFSEGRMHGLGRMVYPDGKVEDGTWRDDAFVGGPAQNTASSGSVVPSDNIKTGSVTVAADEQTLEVFVDGEFVGNTPAKVKLSEGTHVIEVKKAGFKDYKREVKVTEGCELTIRAVLTKDDGT